MNKENLKRECYYIANDIYHQLQMAKYAHVWEIQVCYHFFHWLRKEHFLLEYIENYKHHHIENITGIGLFINRGFNEKYAKIIDKEIVEKNNYNIDLEGIKK